MGGADGVYGRGGVPESLRAMIERQLNHLSAEDRQLLEAASVGGMASSAAAVAAGVEMGVEDVEKCCARLAQRGQFLQASGVEEWPDGTVAGRYTFRHALYQQVLYAQLPAARCRGMHQRIGDRLAAGYGTRAAERAAELALHFERGGDAGRTVAYRWLAAEKALGQWAYQEAIEHLTRGLEALPRLPDTAERMQEELAMQTALGRALMITQSFASPAATQAYTRAHLLCQQVGDPRQLFQVLRGLQVSYQARGELQTARELAEQLLIIAQSLPNRALLSDAHRALGMAWYFLGELARARTHLEQSMALYDPLRHGMPVIQADRGLGLACFNFGAWALWLLGYLEQALQRSQQGLSLADELSSPEVLTSMLYCAATLQQFIREAHMVLQKAEALMVLSQERKFREGLARGMVLSGWALAIQGQGAEGISRIHEGLAAVQAMGLQPLKPYVLSLMAEAYGKGAQAEEGLTVLAEALAIVPKGGGHVYEAELYRLTGELLLALASQRETAKRNRQMAAEGEACFQQALAVARRQQAKSWELRAAMSLSRLWQRQGKHAQAHQLLAPIYNWFTEGFDTADLQEAKALLDEIS